MAFMTNTIPAYVYQEYSDDSDLQAFTSAYNAMAQAYVTFFATVNLPIYTGLTEVLLEWVLFGLYGIPRTSLASPASAAIGPINTYEINSHEIDFILPSTTTFFSLPDDIYQRIATWNLYKGDGKRFCVRWLKRRIMRFLLGLNGTDPQPSQPGFIIGCENTTPVGVAINSTTNVMTVTINQTVLSSLIGIAPNVLQLFQLAFTEGALDLPIQYTYLLNITT